MSNRTIHPEHQEEVRRKPCGLAVDAIGPVSTFQLLLSRFIVKQCFFLMFCFGSTEKTVFKLLTEKTVFKLLSEH
jgi:hypothetical protein